MAPPAVPLTRVVGVVAHGTAARTGEAGGIGHGGGARSSSDNMTMNATLTIVMQQAAYSSQRIPATSFRSTLT
jgi:hypothetical protein